MGRAATRSVLLQDFRGGLNLRRDRLALGESEFPYALNVIPDGRGGLTARPDWKFVGPAGSRQSTRPAVTSDVYVGNTRVDLIVGTNVPFSWSSDSQISRTGQLIYYYPVTSAAQEPVLTQNSMGITSERCIGGVGVANFDGVAYLSRGWTLSGYKWNGVATALTASGAGQWQDSFATPTGTHMPQAEHVCNHAGHLWVAATREDGVPQPNRLRYSHPLFPESWRQEDYIDIPEGGGSIKGLVSIGDALYVLKDESIWQILGYDFESWQRVRVVDGTGCQSQRHAVSGQGALYYVSWPQGVFRLFPGASEPEKISETIETLFTTDHVTLYSFAWSALTFCGGRLQWNVHVANQNLLEASVTTPFGVGQTPSTTAGHPSCMLSWDPQIGAWWLVNGSPTGLLETTGSGLLGLVDINSSGQAEPRTVGQAYSAGSRPWVRIDSTSFSGDDILTSVGPEVTAVQSTQRLLRTRWVDADITAWKKRFVRPELIVREQVGSFSYTWTSFRDWDEEGAARTNAVQFTGANTIGVVVGRLGPLGTSRSAQLLLVFPSTGEAALLQVDYRYVPRNR